jgi:hypothetical protein
VPGKRQVPVVAERSTVIRLSRESGASIRETVSTTMRESPQTRIARPAFALGIQGNKPTLTMVGMPKKGTPVAIRTSLVMGSDGRVSNASLKSATKKLLMSGGEKMKQQGLEVEDDEPMPWEGDPGDQELKPLSWKSPETSQRIIAGLWFERATATVTTKSDGSAVAHVVGDLYKRWDSHNGRAAIGIVLKNASGAVYWMSDPKPVWNDSLQTSNKRVELMFDIPDASVLADCAEVGISATHRGEGFWASVKRFVGNAGEVAEQIKQLATKWVPTGGTFAGMGGSRGFMDTVKPYLARILPGGSVQL